MVTPYVMYDEKIGIPVNLLVTDFDKRNERSLCFIGYRGLRSRITNRKFPEKELRRASWSGPALVQFNSLCKEWRDALIIKFGNPPERIKENYFKKNYVLDSKAFDFYSAHTYGDNDLTLDEKLVEKYTLQASVLNTVLKIKEERKIYAKALGVKSLNIWETLSKDVNAFREVKHGLPITSDGLRRKANTYNKEGYATLISGKLQNSNAQKIAKKSQKAIIDELIAKHSNLDNELIASIYNIVANENEWPTITAKTIANRKKKTEFTTFAGRKGTKELYNKKLMQVKRYAPKAPMLYWCVDGWKAELYYQQATTDKNGNRRITYHNNLTVVIVLDPFNKYPIGYAIGSHETVDLNKKAIRNAYKHVKEILGDYYKPYQIQTDNYGQGALKSFYSDSTKYHTPARVGNAKSKVIEPYFNQINKKYCRLYENFSGYNISSGSKSQPNAEYLDKIKKNFPDLEGCYRQIENIIAQERAKKIKDFVTGFVSKTKPDRKEIMPFDQYLYLFGDTTGYTNKLEPNGFNITIEGSKFNFDCFDLGLRKLSHLDWTIKYDPENLDTAVAVAENGKYRYPLELKYNQPMAIADMIEGDGENLRRINEFNNKAIKEIENTRAENYEVISEFFDERPELNGTLAKALLTDSNGQHKNVLNQSPIHEKTSKMIDRIESKNLKNTQNNFNQQQEEYYNSKIDMNDFLNID